MFIGHFGLGLAAKKLAPKTSLGTLLLSVGFVDVLWPFFLLLGWEHVRIDPGNTVVTPLDFYDYPISHSLLTGVGWGLAFAASYYFFTRYARGALVVGAGVVSHWVLDFVSHRADMPLWPTSDSPKFGLGLWNSLPATLAIEIAIFAWGVWVFTRVSRPSDGVGRWGFVSFIAALSIFYLANLFGPPPPNEQVLAFFGPVVILLYLWPYWVDRHRTTNG